MVYLDRLARAGGTGVAAIGVAQEFQRVFTGTTYHPDEGGQNVPRFGYVKADRRVTAYYFYLVDEAFGLVFIKVCAHFPYLIKIWLDGHDGDRFMLVLGAEPAARLAHSSGRRMCLRGDPDRSAQRARRPLRVA